MDNAWQHNCLRLGVVLALFCLPLQANKYKFSCPESLATEAAEAVERGMSQGLKRAEAYELSQSDEFSEDYFNWVELSEWMKNAPSNFYEVLAAHLRTEAFVDQSVAVRLALVNRAVQDSGVDLPLELREPMARLLIAVRATPPRPRAIDVATSEFINSLQQKEVKAIVSLLAKGSGHGHLGGALLLQVAAELKRQPVNLVVRPSGRGARGYLQTDDRKALRMSRYFQQYCLVIVGKFGEKFIPELVRLHQNEESRNEFIDQQFSQFVEVNGLFHDEIPTLKPIYRRLLIYVYGDRKDETKLIRGDSVRQQLRGGPNKMLRQLRSVYAQAQHQTQIKQAQVQPAQSHQVQVQQAQAQSDEVSARLREPQTLVASQPKEPKSASSRGISRRRQKAENANEVNVESAKIPETEKKKVEFRDPKDVPKWRFDGDDKQAFVQWMTLRSRSERSQILRVFSNLENGIGLEEQGKAITPTREDSRVFRVKLSTATRVWISRHPDQNKLYLVLFWDEQAKASQDRENRSIRRASGKLTELIGT